MSWKQGKSDRRRCSGRWRLLESIQSRKHVVERREPARSGSAKISNRSRQKTDYKFNMGLEGSPAYLSVRSRWVGRGLTPATNQRPYHSSSPLWDANDGKRRPAELGRECEFSGAGS